MLAFLLSYVLLYKYVAIFFVMVLSGLFIPVPINTLLFASGVFASQGFLSLSGTLFVALLGNVVGDLTGYSLTAIWRHRYVKAEHLAKVPYIEALERNVRTYARITIFTTRFLGIAGSAVNCLSGLADVPWPRFVIFDVLGNFLAIAIFLVGGFILGTYSEGIEDAMSMIGWMVAITFVLAILGKYLRDRAKRA